MQYYINQNARKASCMLVFMFLDPIIQNITLYTLTRYVFMRREEGGCCIERSIARSLWIFYCFYMLVLMVAVAL